MLRLLSDWDFPIVPRVDLTLLPQKSRAERPLISARADFDFSEMLSHMCSHFGSIMWLHLAHVVF